MFRITDIGTNISAHLSVIAAVILFSLFTAYQFLSFDRRFDASESKMRPSPSYVCRRVSALMMEMVATMLFLCLLRIKFWVLNLMQNGLDNRLKKSYNTTPAEEGMECDSLFRPHSLTMYLLWAWPHVFVAFNRVDHMRWLVCFLAAFCVVLLCRRSYFERLFYTSKWWPHIIFSDTDLTTFLTIVTSGVHGDKMSGEYEKAVFA